VDFGARQRSAFDLRDSQAADRDVSTLWWGNMDEGWTRLMFEQFNVPFKSLMDAELRKGGLDAATTSSCCQRTRWWR
jgi:hypothetical protein